MHNNEILARLSDALSMDDARMLAIFALGGEDLTPAELHPMLRNPNRRDAVNCKSDRLLRFLDGFIVEQRGPKEVPEGQDAPPAPAPVRMSNNVVLKKLRIAMNLKADDVVAILAAGGTEMTKRQLSALSRKHGNKHYRVCSDQVLESFLTGIAR